MASSSFKLASQHCQIPHTPECVRLEDKWKREVENKIQLKERERETALNIKIVKHINEAKEGEILQVGVGFSRPNFPHDSASLPTARVKLAFQYL